MYTNGTNGVLLQSMEYKSNKTIWFLFIFVCAVQFSYKITLLW